MEWFIFYLVLMVVVGVIANTRGRSGIGWFFLSFLISPLIAVLLVLALSNVKAEQRAREREREAARRREDELRRHNQLLMAMITTQKPDL